MPHHHLPEEFLAAYASGGAPESVALAVASHASLCPGCAARISTMEELGGLLLERGPTAPPADDALDRILSRLAEPAGPTPAKPASIGPANDVFPRPLQHYLAGRPRFRTLLPGVGVVDLPVGPGTARIVRFPPGLIIPVHGHGGDELTLVLAGGIDDGGLHFERGDVAVRCPGEEHEQTIAGGADCIALVVNQGPLLPRTLKGRLLKLLSRT